MDEFYPSRSSPTPQQANICACIGSDRVPLLYASAAIGTVTQCGVSGAAIPAGLMYSSANGKRYFSNKSAVIGSDGKAVLSITAEESGSASNLLSGTLSIASAIPKGLDSQAEVVSIAGGIDAETDEYFVMRTAMHNLVRLLSQIMLQLRRIPTRCKQT